MPGNATSPFRPNTAGTVNLAATSVTGAVALVGAGSDLTITCRGTAGNGVAFVELGTSTVTAAVATGFPMLPGEVFTIGRDSKVTHAAAITATSSDTATVYFTTGEGS